MAMLSPANSCLSLSEGWRLARSAANAVIDPDGLAAQALQWLPAIVPGTVAQTLSVDGELDGDELDEFDWWYQCDFPYSAEEKNCSLWFDGLATIADVWLNGVLILQSRNMFLPQQIDVSAHLQSHNQLTLCFRSLSNDLNKKRPRPRWKTNLVSHQQLRWLRTSLLGRIPGWCPPVAPVGPWRAVGLKQRSTDLVKSHITNFLTEEGRVSAEFIIHCRSSKKITRAQWLVGDQCIDLTVSHVGAEICLTAEAEIAPELRWWPHTHGEPVLLPCKLMVTADGAAMEFDLGTRGFKHLRIDRTDGQVAVVINNEAIFCRGACWTVADIHRLDGDYVSLRRSLNLARDAGINMLRIGGTMIYESDIFYQLCDELGILVWQDFMFANMDYPIDDADFHQTITAEVKAQLTRMSRYVSVSVYCGNSEVQQQSAMMGMTRELWSNSFFDHDLPHWCESLHPGAAYFPSSPCEGALPFSLSEGLSHYYGVGAYKRPLNDAGIANVKFTPETLGFSHIPEPEMVDKIFNGALFAAHNPKWKARVARDSAAGWDFEDIRDHYLALLFNEDAVTLRSHNPQRYLELSRVVTGEVIQRVFAIWRSSTHPCQGALLWFYKDLWAGAGWGIIDSDNQPKAVYYAVKRAAKNLAVYFLDRGLDGLHMSLLNETAATRQVDLELQAFKSGYIETVALTRSYRVEPRSNSLVNVDELLGYFADLTYSYRFGPKQHDLVVARLRDSETGEWLHEDYYFPVNYATAPHKIEGITVEVITREDDVPALKIFTPHFLQSVRLELKSYETEDNYFHLAPNSTRVIRLRSKTDTPQPVKGYLEALNLLEPVKVR